MDYSQFHNANLQYKEKCNDDHRYLKRYFDNIFYRNRKIHKSQTTGRKQTINKSTFHKGK